MAAAPDINQIPALAAKVEELARIYGVKDGELNHARAKLLEAGVQMLSKVIVRSVGDRILPDQPERGIYLGVHPASDGDGFDRLWFSDTGLFAITEKAMRRADFVGTSAILVIEAGWIDVVLYLHNVHEALEKYLGAGKRGGGQQRIAKKQAEIDRLRAALLLLGK